MSGKRITSNIISVAHSLNMKVIVEGIEDEVPINYLIAKGCDEEQDYYSSKPIPNSNLF